MSGNTLVFLCCILFIKHSLTVLKVTFVKYKYRNVRKKYFKELNKI